jgi:hypothetical protein
MNTFTKALLVASSFFVLCSSILLAYYGSAEQYVDENGWLVEQFWALGLGTFSLFSAAVTGLGFAIRLFAESKSQQTTR